MSSLSKSSFVSLRKKAENAFKLFPYSDVINQCFFNTLNTTCQYEEDGSVFVITGDIPAMWLRDSAAQVMQYLYFAEEESVQSLIKGVLKKQFEQICIDPYANAFMRDESRESHWASRTLTNYLPKIVWERKYELDSLCYPFFLAYKYYEKTNDASCFDDLFLKAFDKTMETVWAERKHSQRSIYRYMHRTWEGELMDVVEDSDPNGEKGLIFSAFRPSDDLCRYPYHIPDNMFMASVLDKMAVVFNALGDSNRAEICQGLVAELKSLIEQYGVVEDSEYGKVYVSETDCLGNYHINDDANIPSLLSIPYLEYPFMDKEIYANTRKLILSKRNQYYYEGKVLKGIGSPHTPANRVWPLSLAMQGITSNNEEEIKACFEMLIRSTNGTGLMHEGVDADDVSVYSRPWFAWANSLFAYFVLEKEEIIEKLRK